MNESSDSPKSCPECGATLPADATAGLCPRCLMAEAMAPTNDGSGGELDRTPLTPDELAPHFPQLEILECLGRGGMGVVYQARQKSLDRMVALKLLAPERISDPDFAGRFAQEARALAALNHPNIVTVYDFGQAGGFYFLLMEFVDGVNLRQAMKAGRFTPEQALAVVPPVCEAMQAAHDNGIVHRDIKPENLLLDKDGCVKIADFGIAKMLHADSSDLGLAESQPAGTPQYMAPEQKEPAGADHRADIYSLGVVLYELLTGELPADQLQPPSRKVRIDVRLDEIVLRALESSPELRFQSAADLRTQVETMVMTPAPGRTAAPSSSTNRSRLIKSGFSILTTSERLATFGGQMFCFRSRGQLILDDRQLTHSLNGVDTVIPLAAIRDVSEGMLPRTVNPAGLGLISLTYEEGGETKQRILSPQAGLIASPATHNAGVAEWFRFIREAVTDASGKEPTSTPPERLGLPAGSPGMRLFYAGIILVILAPIGILLAGGNPPVLPWVSGRMSGALILIGLILFAIGLGALARRRGKLPRPDATGGSGVLMIVALVVMVMVVMLGAMFIASTGGFSIDRRPRAEVITTHAPAKLAGNVVTVDFEAAVSHGPAEMQVYLIGPPLSPDEMIDSLGLMGSVDLDVVHPNPIRAGAPFRVSTNGLNRWSAAFVLPTPGLAKKVWNGLRPIGLLDARPDRWLAGELFQVFGPAGATYTGYFAVGPIGQHLKGGREFPTGGHIGHNDHSVMVKHDDVTLHYALYHAGSFDTSSSGAQNRATGAWVDEGSIRLSNKRNFGYRRIDRYPEELTVNGKRHDLRKGRVFVLYEDGAVEQLSLEAPLPLARNPVVLGELIRREQADSMQGRTP